MRRGRTIAVVVSAVKRAPATAPPRRRRGGGRRRTPDHVHPGPPAAFGRKWRVKGGIGGFNAAGGDVQGGRHRHRRG